MPKHKKKDQKSGKGRADSSDEEGSFNDAASMVSDVSEDFEKVTCKKLLRPLTKILSMILVKNFNQKIVEHEIQGVFLLVRPKND